MPLPIPAFPLVMVTVPGGLNEVVRGQLADEVTCSEPVPPELGKMATSWPRVTDAMVVNEFTAELTLMPSLLPTAFQ